MFATLIVPELVRGPPNCAMPTLPPPELDIMIVPELVMAVIPLPPEFLMPVPKIFATLIVPELVRVPPVSWMPSLRGFVIVITPLAWLVMPVPVLWVRIPSREFPDIVIVPELVRVPKKSILLNVPASFVMPVLPVAATLIIPPELLFMVPKLLMPQPTEFATLIVPELLIVPKLRIPPPEPDVLVLVIVIVPELLIVLDMLERVMPVPEVFDITRLTPDGTVRVSKGPTIMLPVIVQVFTPSHTPPNVGPHVESLTVPSTAYAS